LGLLALGLGFLTHAVVSAMNFDAPWWLDMPTPLVLYGLLWTGFDRVAWHWSPWKRLRLVRVPDYRGIWRVEGQSDYGTETPFTGEATIRQTWTAMSIEIETALSRSHTLTGSVLLDPFARPRLSYEYASEPKASATPTLQAHRGAAWLDLKSTDVLEGEYYGGRGSQNLGTLRLVRARA
jgi:hypothetical protein